MEENVIYLAVFDDLPNELLWQIFCQLNRQDLLQMSLVCRRWNQIIFHFLNDRFRFRPEQAEGLCEDRSFRNLDLSRCPLPVPKLGVKWIEYYYSTLSSVEVLSAELVSCLTVIRKDAHMDLLMRLLVTFRNLDTLVWEVPGKMLSYYKIPKVNQRLIECFMAKVRHLVIYAKSKKMVWLVEKLSDHLVTLDVTVSYESLFDFCNSSKAFPNLVSLKLIVKYNGKLSLASALMEFLQNLPKLQKFSFGTNDEDSIMEVTEAETQIEDFEIVDFEDLTFPLLSSIRSLRTFRATGTFVLSFYENAQPNPKITSLYIDQAHLVSVDALVANFPNLTCLRMKTRINSTYEILCLVVTYPNLEDLAIRIADGYELSIILTLIARILKHLRELRINLTLLPDAEDEYSKALQKGNLKVFGIVLDSPTLQKLYIDSMDAAQLVLPAKNAACQVYVNDVLVKCG